MGIAEQRESLLPLSCWTYVEVYEIAARVVTGTTAMMAQAAFDCAGGIIAQEVINVVKGLFQMIRLAKLPVCLG